MGEDWIARWEAGRTGWHETDGNAGLKRFWPALPTGTRVLVPLCGKSPDLAWLASRGYEVTGVELSELAVRGFFDDRGLKFEVATEGGLARYRAKELPLELFCGDYFAFQAAPFDALYDRGALVALPPEDRHRYVQHTRALLTESATRLIVTLEYDQSVVAGPPYAVMPDELHVYWSDLRRVGEQDDLPNSPPKFRAAGLNDVKEVFWLSR